MAHPEPEKVRSWLFARLIEQDFAEPIARDKLMQIAQRSSKTYYQNGTFWTDGLLNWLASDCSVETGKLEAFAQRLKQEGINIGISVTMPGEGKSPTAPPPPEAKPNGSKPAPPAHAVAKPAPSPARESGPKIEELIADSAYMEQAVLDWARNEKKDQPDIVKKAVEKFLELSESEFRALKSPGLKPGQGPNSAAEWTLRVNGLAAGLCLAKAIVVSKAPYKTEIWNKGVNKVKSDLGSIATRIIAKIAETKSREPEAAQALADAWKRASEIIKQIESYTSKQQETAQTTLVPETEKPKRLGGLSSLFSKKKNPTSGRGKATINPKPSKP